MGGKPDDGQECLDAARRFLPRQGGLGQYPCAANLFPCAASANIWGKVSKIACRAMLPPPLPEISNPELRRTAAGTETVDPAISPMETKRIRNAHTMRNENDS
ncbi:MAG: hypothetical protein IMW89_15625 [Ktedonobacteraceae bacterium]|nr:hypothetical protein [Ktedonobacteraceae bacterium]